MPGLKLTPTNEERREVAARLQAYESLHELFRDSPICAFIEVLGVGYLNWVDICKRLADLIEPEPEPEQTCSMEYDKELSGGEIYPTEAYRCSKCGYITLEGLPNFCSDCGARVKEDTDAN